MIPSEQYRILERLGDQRKRKFNEVFLVEDKHSGERGTMKVLAKTPGNTALQERLRQEATFVFELPQLPGTLSVYESESELVVVRSWQEGMPLGAFLKTVRSKHKPAVLLKVLQGLQPIFAELNKQHIVHLDLKPSNILVNGTTEQLDVALIDFGMAMHTDHPEQRKTLFPLGYAAPELLLNRLHLVDQRTDLFALGIVLWQALAGTLPLVHPNPGITTNLQLTHPIPTHDAIPKKLQAVIERLCAKYSFGVPPNQLPETETDQFLRTAMDQRYSDFNEVLTDWEAGLPGKRWFW